MNQDDLFNFLELNENMGRKLLSLIEEVIHKNYGFKPFCYDIKREESQIRDALNGNGKYFSITWLPFLLYKAPIASQKIIDYLCDIAKLDHPQPQKHITPEEELNLLKNKIKEHGLGPLFEKLGAG